jgi:hypothetical protein
MSQSKLFKIKWILLGGLILGCGVILMIWFHRSSNQVISEDKFVDVYVKLSLANEMFSSDSLKFKDEKRKIFEQAQVTPQEMDRFVSRHNLKPEEWVDIWKRILEKLEQEKQELKTP